ncbi:hypothetical protein C8R46DRAFT_1037759 [Mycena filopes]|nr:hypothetical protein C8R46DRAFT_1037759 [Mycena filopes]
MQSARNSMTNSAEFAAGLELVETFLRAPNGWSSNESTPTEPTGFAPHKRGLVVKTERKLTNRQRRDNLLLFAQEALRDKAAMDHTLTSVPPPEACVASGISQWLRLRRLHKYQKCFEGMDLKDLSTQTAESLEKLGVYAEGARRRLMQGISEMKLQ